MPLFISLHVQFLAWVTKDKLSENKKNTLISQEKKKKKKKQHSAKYMHYFFSPWHYPIYCLLVKI